ncbi:hypothetical protein ACN28S_32200 [Cystobacter fuscus]
MNRLRPPASELPDKRTAPSSGLMRKTDAWLVLERRIHHMANLEEARAVFSGIYSEAKLEPSRQPAFSCEHPDVQRACTVPAPDSMPSQ